MSNTAVDFAKITQLLDSGWLLRVFRNALGSYTVIAEHGSQSVMRAAISRVVATYPQAMRNMIEEDDCLTTDDFTPQQALTRMAYKVHGEII